MIRRTPTAAIVSHLEKTLRVAGDPVRAETAEVSRRRGGLLTLHSEPLGPSDLVLVERMIRTSGTWALVDGLAANVAGSLVERHAAYAVLDRWATDPDRDPPTSLCARRSSI